MASLGYTCQADCARQMPMQLYSNCNSATHLYNIGMSRFVAQVRDVPFLGRQSVWILVHCPNEQIESDQILVNDHYPSYSILAEMQSGYVRDRNTKVSGGATIHI